jgi:hypothetical protein
MLTQAELKSKLHYNTETGIFTRFIKYKNQIKKAGSKQTNGYIYISINKIDYLAHRLAWLYVYGEFPKNQIDHINRIRDDNKISNLRESTQSENLMNISISSHNTSGYKGVSFDKSKNKFMACIQINSRQIFIGRYKTAKEASIAYSNYAKEIQGEFYCSKVSIYENIE